MTASEFLAPIVLVAALMAGLLGYVFIRTPASDLVKYLVVAAVLAGSTFAAQLFIGRLGYAIPLPIPQQARLIDYRVVMDGGRKSKIEIWLLEDQSRLHVVPYSKEAEKALKDVQKQAKEKGGVPVVRGIEDSKQPFETDILTPEQELPKEP